jgi:hypothetical protein
MKVTVVCRVLLGFFCGLSVHVSSEEIPKEIILRSDSTTGLYRDGKFSRSVQLKAGTVLRVVRYERGSFITEYEGGEVKVDRFNTELARTNMPALLRMTQPMNTPTAPVVAGPLQVTATSVYAQSKRAAEQGRWNEQQYIGDDLKVCKLLSGIADKVVSAFEVGDTNAAMKLWMEREQLIKVALREPIKGYQYNEFAKEEVAVPVRFDLFRGGEAFYFRVGDGSFSTVATVTVSDWKSFMDGVEKLDRWLATCRSQKLETRKELCTVGGTTFTFVVWDQGRMWFVDMAVQGDDRRDTLLSSSKVKLAPLNFWRLHTRMREALKIAQEHLKEEKAAEKLR